LNEFLNKNTHLITIQTFCSQNKNSFANNTKFLSLGQSAVHSEHQAAMASDCSKRRVAVNGGQMASSSGWWVGGQLVVRVREEFLFFYFCAKNIKVNNFYF